MNFQLRALEKNIFESYFAKSVSQLAAHGAVTFQADHSPGYPCRVSLTDAMAGETVLAVPYCHHDVVGPYRSIGPIFVRADAVRSEPAVNEVPRMFRHRLLSVRAYNQDRMMILAENAMGGQLESVLRKQFSKRDVAYIHLHNSQPGCFNCVVERV